MVAVKKTPMGGEEETGGKHRFFLFLKQMESFAFCGETYIVGVQQGCIEVLGHRMHSGTKGGGQHLYSPDLGGALVITAVPMSRQEDERAARETGKRKRTSSAWRDVLDSHCQKVKASPAALTVVELMEVPQCKVAQDLQYFPEYRRVWYDPDPPATPDAAQLQLPKGMTVSNNHISIPANWSMISETATDASRNILKGKEQEPATYPVFLVLGCKDVGKSTFTRYLVNQLLASHQSVAYMDCDVGQTEFGPPGLLSLHEVSSPLLGPPCTHIQTPKFAHFAGGVSPKDAPQEFVAGIASVWEAYKSRCRTDGLIPLVVNTMGWVKGLGLPILCDTLRVIKPQCVIQINSPVEAKNLDDISEGVPGDSLWPDSQPPSWKIPHLHVIESVSGEHVRRFKLSGKDHRAIMMISYFGRSIATQAPYEVSWNSVGVHILWDLVPPSELFRCLNTALVGLCIVDEPLEDSNGATPLVYHDMPRHKCVGLGCIRAIDQAQGKYFIVTPVSVKVLADVNLLVKGDGQLPVSMLIQGSIGKGPYMTCDFSSSAVQGTSARSTRTNIDRKKYQGSK